MKQSFIKGKISAAHQAAILLHPEKDVLCDNFKYLTSQDDSNDQKSCHEIPALKRPDVSGAAMMP